MLNFLKAFVPVSIKNVARSLVVRQYFPLPHKKRVFVFLSADYGNVGDLAISAAQKAYLAKVLFGYVVVTIPISETRDVLRSIKKQISNDDIVTIIGGGNMGSLYPDIEALRQLVIQSFPQNRVICFPQTLDWDESEASRRAIKRIVRVYSSHADLHLFARETVSFGRLQEMFAEHKSVNVRHVPDIVLSATSQDLGINVDSVPQGALLCLRDDRERSLGNEHREAIHIALADASLDTEITDTHVGGSRLDPERCAQLLKSKLNQFQDSRLIVTDRLHGMILAALVGTPCLVLPNSNHKIHQTWQDWLVDVPQVHYMSLAELPNVGAAVQKLLAVPRRNPTSPVIDSVHFDDLSAALQNR